ncbi:DUF6916 family protein [Thalassospira marina]|uniref:DUF6916 domain-containing protein n=1 Tax=Thalassospira marina TaxID=2048283 RepID=A0A2N3KBP0_9PROT|nr:hypothetical protein [Thalassospira marina]AUG54029.1 hypothetical protein CSC3H3_15840 [Thalassospira marina]PKR47978.1 hypothetical protein COO20_25250 [Thalassospira marina]
MTEANTSDLLSLAKLTSDIFTPHLESTFIFNVGNTRLPVTLVNCRENPEGAGPDSNRTPFSLLFHTSADQNNPILEAKDFTASVHGLEQGAIDLVSVQRVLRPASHPAGAYFQIIFG